MHIHKTAGTSATNSFAHGFRDNEVCPLNFEYQFTRENLINMNINNFLFFRGHISVRTKNKYFKDAFIFSCIREPIERLQSLYLHLKKQASNKAISPNKKSITSLKISKLSFEEFILSNDTNLNNIKNNVQAKLLAGAYYAIVDQSRRTEVIFEDHEDDILKSALNFIKRKDTLICTTNNLNKSISSLKKIMHRNFGELKHLNSSNSNEKNELYLSPKAYSHAREITNIDKKLFNFLNRN